MNGDAVAGFESGKIAQHGGDFVHALVEFLIGDNCRRFVFRFGDENQSRFIFVFGEMAVHAVVAGVEFSAHEPFPERRIRGVESFAPGLVPIEKLGVDVETFREMFLAEFFYEGGINEIGLRDKFLGRVEVLFFFPVNGNLRFGQVCFCSSMPSLLFSGELWPRRQLPLRCSISDVTLQRRTAWFRQTHFLCKTSLPAKNDAPTQARESMRASRRM